MAHPLPSDILDNCDGILYCFADWANQATGGFFWVFLLLGFIVVLFMGTIRFGTARAFGFSGMVSILGAIWLVVLNLISWNIAVPFIIVGTIGIATLFLSEK